MQENELLIIDKEISNYWRSIRKNKRISFWSSNRRYKIMSKIRDGKNRFYRTLNLDNDTKKLLKWYRKVVKKMKQESDKK